MSPARTYAVVVGIEHYRFESSNLDGPCEDAVRFVEWLRKNGVPASNILLFLSPLDENRESLAVRLRSPLVSVDFKTADSIEIPRCLEGLQDRSLYNGELLYFYWGGHGIADRGGRRYLFYADTTENTLHKHLDVPSWMQRLASYGNFPSQIGYIDACANLKPQWNLGSNQVPAGPPNAKQSIFFAAAIGQRAANNDLRKSGQFSKVLREVLKEVQAKDPVWPPAPRSVINFLRVRFQADRTQMPVFYEAGDFEGNQYGDGELPASEFVELVARQSGYAVRSLRAWADSAAKSSGLSAISQREAALRLLEDRAELPDGNLGKVLSDPIEDWVRTFAVAIDKGLLPALLQFIHSQDPYSKALIFRIHNAQDLKELDRLIEQARPSELEVREAYRRTAVPLSSPDIYSKNRQEMLDKLALALDDDFRHVAEFVLRLNARPQSEELRQWALNHVKPATFFDIEAQLAQESGDPMYHLLFWIKSKQLTAVLYRGNEFAFVKKWPPVEFQIPQLEELIETRLAMAEEYSQNLFVQFLVSREYFSWSPQAVLVHSPIGPPAPLGSTYSTVMRWRERALCQARTRHAEWAQRAPRVLDMGEECAKVTLRWIDEDIDPANAQRLLRLVGVEDQAVAFDFVAPRTFAAPRSALAAAILGGIPVLLWPCEEPADRALMRATVTEYSSKGNLLRWGEEMKRFYESAERAWRVTLFWDDPRKRPEKWEYADEF